MRSARFPARPPRGAGGRGGYAKPLARSGTPALLKIRGSQVACFHDFCCLSYFQRESCVAANEGPGAESKVNRSEHLLMASLWALGTAGWSFAGAGLARTLARTQKIVGQLCRSASFVATALPSEEKEKKSIAESASLQRTCASAAGDLVAKTPSACEPSHLSDRKRNGQEKRVQE